MTSILSYFYPKSSWGTQPPTSSSIITPSKPFEVISSIEQAEPSQTYANGLFSPPVLESDPRPSIPTHPILYCLYLMEKTYESGMHSLSDAAQELEIRFQRSQDFIAKMQTAFGEFAKKADEAGIWSNLQKAGAYILSTFNLIFGFTLYASGNTELGSTLVAAGLLSIANFAMTEMKGWDALAEKLAKGNKDFKDQIIFWAPITLHCLSTLPSVIALYGGASLPNLLSDLENSLQVFTKITSAGKNFTEAQIAWMRASLSDLQNAITSNTLLQDHINSYIQAIMQLLEQIGEKARTIMQLHSNLRM